LRQIKSGAVLQSFLTPGSPYPRSDDDERGYYGDNLPMAWKPDGQAIAVSWEDSSDHVVMIWQRGSAAPPDTLRTDDLIHAIAWSPDGKVLAAIQEGKMSLWQADSHTLRVGLQYGSGGGYSAVFRPDSKMLAVSTYDGEFRAGWIQ